ncbi:phosphotransferase family protein [Micromonospora sp. HK10]|uniref:phosphotransferase family protein n=1 Tax=Micromonospora sp. HK10 TaxID=1538294 RepID=UPI000626F26D|nr:aminoglycoside phosphotransferase family protein [Micromonospora sp. HK10]KKK06389.1 aminoglycoside phosphotransferase [Micromonospora sp. HK10]
MSRTVTLVLVDPTGRPLGALPRYEVPEPWWQQVGSIVDGARHRYGVDVAVLRLLAADRPEPPGGHLTYLAEVSDPPPVPLAPVPVGADHGASHRVGPDLGRRSPPEPGHLAPHPLRAPWAEPGGPARSLAWATAELDRLGRPVTAVRQHRTWNLSAIWQLDTESRAAGAGRAGSADAAGRAAGAGSADAASRAAGAGAAGSVWLKQVPAFFRHEAAVLRWLAGAAPDLAPTLLAADGTGRLLLDHAPGEDRYAADPAERAAIAADHHPVQRRAAGDVPALLAAGVPDLRGPALAGWIRDRLAPHDVAVVADLLAGLDDRLARLADCGLPDTLVHGDLHPGNVRGDGRRRTLIDWGDAFVGHPAFDILRLTDTLDEATAAPLRAAWAARWQADVPGSDPYRAVDLLRPVAPLRMAAVYAMFLAGIEPAEHPYHRNDVPACLKQAAAAA